MRLKVSFERPQELAARTTAERQIAPQAAGQAAVKKARLRTICSHGRSRRRKSATEEKFLEWPEPTSPKSR
jgi:hypothetical protein